jgi:metal transporter CNNM
MNILLIILPILFLIVASAIFSGLNIALMSLDPSELRRQKKLGSKAAAKILPFRQNIHLSLASIILTNIAIISATSLVLDQHLSGLAAGALGTLLIVVFGEMLPQALFAKNALQWTARFSWLLRLTTIAAFPIAKPLQLLLDRIVGHRQNRLYGREELGMLITEHVGSAHSELDEDEIEIMNSVLMLSEKRVSSIMTPIEQVYWLTPDATLSDARMEEIISKGYSRIPVFNPELTDCVGILLIKDLVTSYLDAKPYVVSGLPLYEVSTVGSRVALDTLFRRFTNSSTHMLPVERGDKIIGVVTIEDLIEEIIGHEIQDETDRLKNRA